MCVMIENKNQETDIVSTNLNLQLLIKGNISIVTLENMVTPRLNKQYNVHIVIRNGLEY